MGLLMTKYPGPTLKPSWRIAQLTMQSVVSCILAKFMTNIVTVLISFLNFRSCAKYWYDSRFLWHFKDIQIYVKTDIYLDFCYTNKFKSDLIKSSLSTELLMNCVQNLNANLKCYCGLIFVIACKFFKNKSTKWQISVQICLIFCDDNNTYFWLPLIKLLRFSDRWVNKNELDGTCREGDWGKKIPVWWVYNKWLPGVSLHSQKKAEWQLCRWSLIKTIDLQPNPLDV